MIQWYCEKLYNDETFGERLRRFFYYRKMEVINEAGVPIPGLYAVGTDGCELYRETYTMNVPASCNGNNCNSGRTAAKNAVASL